ncbi:hypothetical protein ACA910_005223 [Epithemia clementina (nom. ined.)]
MTSAVSGPDYDSRGLSSDDDSMTTNMKDSDVLADSIVLYGGLLVLTIFVFSWLRRLFPKVYNIRSWVEELKTYLAEDQYRFFSWLWRVYMITDDELMNECGMDAACFIHLIQMGYRLSLIALFNMLWLLPIYMTAEDSEETSYITDRVVRTTVANVPSGSHRLYATVLAAYIMFGYTMYQILVEFEWYTEMRHKFLRKPMVRHYAIFVRNIPVAYRSNISLEEFFRNCFSDDAVLEARLAVHTPSLGRIVAQREATLANLEHALAIYEKEGVRPTQKDKLLVLGESIDSIDYYTEQLEQQNIQVKRRIEALQAIVSGAQLDTAQSPEGHTHTPETQDTDFFSFNGDEAPAQLDEPKYPQSGSPVGPENPEKIEQFVPAEATKYGEGPHGSLTTATTDQGRTASQGSLALMRSSVTTAKAVAGTARAVAGVAGKATTTASKVATRAVRESVFTVAGIATSAATRAMSMLLGEDGEVHSAGFVVFTKRSITNAAKQMIHHEKPFCMEVTEAPDPKDVFWANIGRTHKDLQVGMLASFGASAGLCLLWTIPMSFFASLSNASAVRQDFKWLDNMFNQYPGLVKVTEQLAPFLVVAFNWILPNILETITLFEGPISSGKVQASKFIKLAAFTIIQTFFVSAISGSVIQTITEIIEDWTKVIDLLANTLPAQGTYFMQILLVSTATTAGVEMLRLIPIALAILRRHIGPRLTEKERSKIYVGLRPLSCPQDFEHADYTAQLVLYYMVLFVYAVIYPMTPLITSVCFVFMGAMFRGQFIYVYDKYPDSGGKLWAHYIQVMLTCMIIAEITIFGLLGLKKAVQQLPLFLPLLFITILFNFYIRQIHFRVASYLPTRECLIEDHREGAFDISTARGAYLQPSLAADKELLPETEKKDSSAQEEVAADEEMATNSGETGNFSDCLGATPYETDQARNSSIQMGLSLLSRSFFSTSATKKSG